jgi:hypothetical protein
MVMARPQAADHDEKRHAILESAARLFAKRGFGGTSMAMIADRFGAWPGGVGALPDAEGHRKTDERQDLPAVDHEPLLTTIHHAASLGWSGRRGLGQRMGRAGVTSRWWMIRSNQSLSVPPDMWWLGSSPGS